MDSKKFNKILCKLDIKGLVKLCNTFENADLIFVYLPNDLNNSMFLNKEVFKKRTK